MMSYPNFKMNEIRYEVSTARTQPSMMPAIISSKPHTKYRLNFYQTTDIGAFPRWLWHCSLHSFAGNVKPTGNLWSIRTKSIPRLPFNGINRMKVSTLRLVSIRRNWIDGACWIARTQVHIISPVVSPKIPRPRNLMRRRIKVRRRKQLIFEYAHHLKHPSCRVATRLLTSLNCHCTRQWQEFGKNTRVTRQ